MESKAAKCNRRNNNYPRTNYRAVGTDGIAYA